MNATLKRLKNIKAEACVTLILNTHRTRPDNLKDSLSLKNLIKNAESRLLNDYDKKIAQAIIGKLNKLAESIDHQHNLESLILFVNTDIAEYVRLPLEVTERAVIDNTFATRDLVRAMHQEASYYVLVISRQQARLIEAYNDKVVFEDSSIFPIINALYTTDKKALSTNKGTDILFEEFFNSVDKSLQNILKENPLPILLATEQRNFEYYKKIADNKQIILGFINRNRDDEKAHHIIPDAWEVVKQVTLEKNAARLKELDIAISARKFLSDINDIWNAINQGRGQTLFVKKDYFQAGIIKDDVITLIEQEEVSNKECIDDIVDELIEMNLSYGGDIVFIENNALDTYNNLVLTTRY